MDSKKPWEIHKALTPEKLCTVGSILADIRRKALDVYDPDEGDGTWCNECTIYQRTLNILKRSNDTHPWLKISDTGLYFIMFIDDVPVRYYKGQFDKPNKRSLNIRTNELIPHEQLCLLDPEYFHWYWRIILETDENRMASRVGIAQFREGTEVMRNLWTFPQHAITNISLVTSEKREPTILAPPTISLKTKDIADGKEIENGRE
jgi:hypothetical protein